METDSDEVLSDIPESELETPLEDSNNKNTDSQDNAMDSESACEVPELPKVKTPPAESSSLTERRRSSRRSEEEDAFLGAATLKERFENKAVESKKPVTSSHRNFGAHLHDSTDGGEERHSAHSLKARFEAKIKDNAPVKRNFVINRGGSGAAKKFGGGAPTSNKCQVCTKTVYPMEKLEADGNVYHKFCFKCKTCGRTVGLGSYAALAGDIYCKPHLKQLFKLKGNYDEGFGREQRKADWVKKDPNAKPSQASTQAVDAEPAQEVEPAETED